MADSNNQDKAQFGPVVTAYMELLREHGEDAVNDMARDNFMGHMAWIEAQPKHVVDWEEFKKVPQRLLSAKQLDQLAEERKAKHMERLRGKNKGGK